MDRWQHRNAFSSRSFQILVLKNNSVIKTLACSARSWYPLVFRPNYISTLSAIVSSATISLLQQLQPSLLHGCCTIRRNPREMFRCQTRGRYIIRRTCDELPSRDANVLTDFSHGYRVSVFLERCNQIALSRMCWTPLLPFNQLTHISVIM